jgi:hypothetical protein
MSIPPLARLGAGLVSVLSLSLTRDVAACPERYEPPPPAPVPGQVVGLVAAGLVFLASCAIARAALRRPNLVP